jgi:molybdopterin biosynthesis enzyme
MGLPTIAQAGLSIIGTAAELQDNQVQGMQEQIDAEQNERLAHAAAADAIARGNREAAQQRALGSAIIGEQRVGLASSGVELSEGTAAEVQTFARAATETDARTIENNAAREAWGFEKTADDIHRNAKIDAEMRYQNKQLGDGARRRPGASPRSAPAGTPTT